MIKIKTISYDELGMLVAEGSLIEQNDKYVFKDSGTILFKDRMCDDLIGKVIEVQELQKEPYKGFLMYKGWCVPQEIIKETL